MLFSIILPVFNMEHYLRDCLSCVLKQSYKDFEVVVINDGSTDLSAKIVKEFAQKDQRIKLYNYSNAGVATARKNGLKNAKGEYIIFIDADDTINEDLLYNIWKTITTFPEVDLIRFKADRINDLPGYDTELHNNGTIFNEIISGIDAIKDWTNSSKRYELFWLYAIKKERALTLLDTPNFTTCGDYAFIPVLIAGSKKVVMIDYVGYNYTCNNQESLTHLPGDKKVKERTRNFIRAYSFVTENVSKILNDNGEEFPFFFEEWRRRLLKKYMVLTNEQKKELKPEFEQVLGEQVNDT